MIQIINILRLGVIGLGIFCISSVIFALTISDRWWMRVFDYPRLQITLLSGAILLLSLFVLNRRKVWAKAYLAILTTAFVYQLYILHPYLLPIAWQVPTRQAAEPQRTFSLLVANVLMENHEAQSYISLVEKNNPDVVLVIEPDTWWTDQLHPLRERYDYNIEQPQDNHYGMNLYSRLPLLETEINYFEEKNTPSIYAVLQLPSGDEVIFYGVHPRPPLPENSVSAADKELIKIAQRIKKADRPAVVAGDFNDVPWSYTVTSFQEISQLGDVRVGRGLYNTFNAKSFVLRLPLDHVYTSPGLGLVEIKSPISFSSDHLALYVRLVVDESVR